MPTFMVVREFVTREVYLINSESATEAADFVRQNANLEDATEDVEPVASEEHDVRVWVENAEENSYEKLREDFRKVFKDDLDRLGLTCDHKPDALDPTKCARCGANRTDEKEAYEG